MDDLSDELYILTDMCGVKWFSQRYQSLLKDSRKKIVIFHTLPPAYWYRTSFCDMSRDLDSCQEFLDIMGIKPEEYLSCQICFIETSQNKFPVAIHAKEIKFAYKDKSTEEKLSTLNERIKEFYSNLPRNVFTRNEFLSYGLQTGCHINEIIYFYLSGLISKNKDGTLKVIE